MTKMCSKSKNGHMQMSISSFQLGLVLVIIMTSSTFSKAESVQQHIKNASWGDQVINTIDNHTYIFNGHGEYLFLDVNDGKFIVQARTDYVTEENTDATQFVAFALKDVDHKDSLTIWLNRTDKVVHVFNKGKVVYKSTDPPPSAGHPPSHTEAFMIFPGPIVQFRRLRLQALNAISFNGGSFLSISLLTKGHDYPNTTGLAGALHNGSYVQRNGTSFAANALENELFAYGESWSLENESESIFNYNLTNGNFSLYNDHHTRPRFLEDLLGNFVELFKGHTKENIDKFKATCTNSWDNQLNNDCLLMIARTGNSTKGTEIMDESLRIHNKYELNHNMAPVFRDTMPLNITVYLGDMFTLDVASFVIDEDNATEMTFIVDTELTSQYIEHGKFNWSVSDELRNMDTSLSFTVKDHLGFPASHKIAIRYCGCELKEECNFDWLQGNSSTDILEKASCHCPNKHITGDYCEVRIDPCESITCFQNNTCDSISTKDNPCEPCVAGYMEVFSINVQECNDVDECSSDSSNKCPINSNCSNTIGSYTCACGEGFGNNEADNNVCDDMDECANKTDTCKEDEKCVNVAGSYRCECYPGFQKVTGICSKIVGFSYAGSISITITSEVGPETKVDTFENKQSAQIQLTVSLGGIPGFVSVEVISITKVQIQVNVTFSRKKRNVDQKYVLHVNYIVHLKNKTSNTDVHNAVETQLNSKPLNSTIGSIRIEPRSVKFTVSKNGLCDTDTTDCDRDTTVCKPSDGSFSCDCKDGYKSVNTSQKYCKDINECETEKTQMVYQCVHGKCSNLIGSWNCTCPEGRIWQSVGNTSHPVYRCQGTYQYIGETTISWTSAVKYNISEAFRTKIIDTYRNSSYPLTFNQQLTMAELLVSINIVNFTQDNLNTSHNATVLFEITVGEPLAVEQIIQFQKNISFTTSSFGYPNSTISVITLKVFNDNEYSICNVPGNTNCDLQTTRCTAANGSYTCPCQTGYKLIKDVNNICTDINECETIKDQCVHGKCSNLIGSWNCTCPAERIWQSVGNTSHPVYRCQGNYQYIGEVSMRFLHYISNISDFFKTKILETYRSSLYELIFNGSKLRMSDLLVSINILNSTDSNTLLECLTFDIFLSKSPIDILSHPISFNTRIAYEITIGEALDVQQVKNFQSMIFNKTKTFMNERTELIIDELKIFNDTEYNICDIDGRTQCDVLSTVCSVANGSYTCPCSSVGFRSKPSLKYRCEDINECHSDGYICSGGNCNNSPVGNWTCDCDPGYISVWQSQFNVSCQDINECATKDNTTQSTCINTNGSWHYQCEVGYEHIENTNNQSLCTDTDECQDASKSDAVSTCSNTDGSYYIKCHQGYTHNETANNQSKCKDIDECSNTTVRACLDSVKCDNTPGAWTCECRNGVAPVVVNKTTFICGGDYKYVIDFTFVVVSSETVNKTALGQFMKEQTEIIYKTSYPTVRVVLISVDIVLSRKRAADINAIGHNYDAKFVLHFDTQKMPADLTTVWDAYNSKTCHNRTCPETRVGKYAIYFYGIVADTDGTRGICSIDKENICDLHSTTCSDDNGKLKCSCKTGYKPGSHQYECKDIDECAAKTDTCKDDEKCVNGDGNYRCECYPGFQKDKEATKCTRIDVDECSSDSSNKCPVNSNCSNTVGSYTCKCNEGFVDNGTDNHMCDDIDECANKTDTCKDDEKCVNVYGSYQCECYPGYQREGEKCSRIVGCSNAGSISINIMSEVGPETEVNTVDNKHSAQTQLTVSVGGTSGFVSVEVVSTTKVQIQVNVT